MCDKRDRAITFKFCLDLHLPLVSSGLLEISVYRKVEVWRKVKWNKLLSRLSHKVCRSCFPRPSPPPPPTHLLQDRDCSARYAQDHKIKFPMIKEEYVCNLFTIFESKKVYIQKLAFCGAFSVRPCPWVAASQTGYIYFRVPNHLAILIENRIPFRDSNITLRKSLWFPGSRSWASGPPSSNGWSSISFCDFDISIYILWQVCFEWIKLCINSASVKKWVT